MQALSRGAITCIQIACTQTLMHTHASSSFEKHAHAHTYILANRYIYICIYMYTQADTRINVYDALAWQTVCTHREMHTQTYTCIQMHKHACSYVHMHVSPIHTETLPALVVTEFFRRELHVCPSFLLNVQAQSHPERITELEFAYVRVQL